MAKFTVVLPVRNTLAEGHPDGTRFEPCLEGEEDAWAVYVRDGENVELLAQFATRREARHAVANFYAEGGK